MKSNLLFLAVLFLVQTKSFAVASLDGFWQMGCSSGLIKQQYIHGTNVLNTEKFYADSGCQKVSFIFETRGTIAFSDENSAWIDFTYQEIRLSVFNQSALNDLNARKVCGVSNWTFGEAQVITGLQCALFNVNKPTQIPRLGDLKFGIFSLQVDKLFYGQMTPANDGSTAAKRPVSLVSEPYLFQALTNTLY